MLAYIHITLPLFLHFTLLSSNFKFIFPEGSGVNSTISARTPRSPKSPKSPNTPKTPLEMTPREFKEAIYLAAEKMMKSEFDENKIDGNKEERDKEGERKEGDATQRKEKSFNEDNRNIVRTKNDSSRSDKNTSTNNMKNNKNIDDKNESKNETKNETKNENKDNINKKKENPNFYQIELEIEEQFELEQSSGCFSTLSPLCRLPRNIVQLSDIESPTRRLNPIVIYNESYSNDNNGINSNSIYNNDYISNDNSSNNGNNNNNNNNEINIHSDKINNHIKNDDRKNYEENNRKMSSLHVEENNDDMSLLTENVQITQRRTSYDEYPSPTKSNNKSNNNIYDDNIGNNSKQLRRSASPPKNRGQGLGSGLGSGHGLGLGHGLGSGHGHGFGLGSGLGSEQGLGLGGLLTEKLQQLNEITNDGKIGGERDKMELNNIAMMAQFSGKRKYILLVITISYSLFLSFFLFYSFLFIIFSFSSF